MKFERLGNICTVRNGYAFKSEQFVEDGVPIIRISDIKGNFVKSEKAVRIKYNSSFENFKITNGDLLIAMSGATTGKYGIYNSDEIGFQNQRVGCFVIKDKEKLSNDYLLQALRFLKPVIERKAHGSGQPNISGKDIEELEIPLPSLSDQIQIANILSKAETLIEQRKESIALLDEFLKSTFLEMFGDPIKNDKGWEEKTIESFVKKEKYSLKRGPFGGALKKEIFVPSGYLVYEQYHALNNDFTFARYFIDETKFQELKAFEVSAGDIIISCSGVYLGKLAIIPQGAKRGIINQALLKISLDEKIINNQFFIFLFSHPSFKTKFYGNIVGTGIPNFPSMADFKKFNFIYPPIELQTQFATIVNKTETLKAQYQQSLQQLENLYGSLSQKAFKGELEMATTA